MAKESKTVQCYPSDDKINAMVRRYESFGWELIGNQRFQEYTGQTRVGDNTVSHYSTYNKLTFSREKSSPWYADVKRLEDEHDAMLSTCEAAESSKPTKPSVVKPIALFSVLFIVGLVLFFVIGIFFKLPGLLPGIWVAVVAVALVITLVVRNVNYKKNLSAWHAENDADLAKSRSDCERLCERARVVIQGSESRAAYSQTATTAKFCPECGAEIVSNGAYCGKCGAKLR